jgi:hypothetical protein
LEKILSGLSLIAGSERISPIGPAEQEIPAVLPTDQKLGTLIYK